MDGGILEQIQNAVGGEGTWQVLAVAAVAMAVALFIAWRLFSGRRPAAPAAPNLTIDVMAQGTQGPPVGGPTLEFYNIPVRLAVVVLAPAGRVRDLPPEGQWHDLFDAIVPGLADVVASHRPLVRRWPSQPSSRGFAHQFFQHVRLPGQSGKGTPWSSAAGVMKIEGQAVMAGMVFRTQEPSAHGQEIIESEEQWLRILRVNA
jgi:hypothetical protein